MRILSFDVGIKNLAYCIYYNENDSFQIELWDVSEIPVDMEKILNCLDTMFPTSLLENIDIVVIEKQPGRNCKMKRIEIILNIFFILKNIRKVVIYHAKHKLGNVGKMYKGKTNYNQRKKLSIERCKLFLMEYNKELELKKLLASKKKDDLADCLLQILAFINHKFYVEFQFPNSEYKNEIKLKITSRKPTEKQSKTCYSKSNIKYFINNNSKDFLISDNKFIKAINRHYDGNIDAAYNELS